MVAMRSVRVSGGSDGTFSGVSVCRNYSLGEILAQPKRDAIRAASRKSVKHVITFRDTTRLSNTNKERNRPFISLASFVSRYSTSIITINTDCQSPYTAFQLNRIFFLYSTSHVLWGIRVSQNFPLIYTSLSAKLLIIPSGVASYSFNTSFPSSTAVLACTNCILGCFNFSTAGLYFAKSSVTVVASV